MSTAAVDAKEIATRREKIHLQHFFDSNSTLKLPRPARRASVFFSFFTTEPN